MLGNYAINSLEVTQSGYKLEINKLGGGGWGTKVRRDLCIKDVIIEVVSNCR